MLTLEEYITQRGVTLAVFCQALKISPESLEPENISIRIVKSQKKHGTFWEMRAFLSDIFSVGIGLSGYEEEVILRTLESIQKAAIEGKKLIGVWQPPRESFISWLNEQVPARIKKNAKKIKKEKKAELTPEEIFQRDRQRYISKILTIKNSLPKVNTLQKILSFLEETLQKTSLASKQKEYEQNIQIVKTAIAFRQDDFHLLIASFVPKPREITYYDGQQKLLLKLLLKPDRIEYKDCTISLSQVLSICSLMQTEKHRQEREKESRHWKDLWQGIPEQYKDKIDSLKIMAKQHWEKLYCIPGDFYNFLLESTRNKEIFFVPKYTKIRCQEDLNHWLSSMFEAVEEAIQKPSFLNNAMLEILSLVYSTPKYGVKTYALWLGKSQAKLLDNKRLDNAFRGKLASYKTDQIVEEIEKLISRHCLEIITVGTHNLPVVKLTQDGIKILESLKHSPKESVAIQTLEKPKQPEPAYLHSNKISYYDLLQDIHNGNRQGWINFLKQEDIAKEMEAWDTNRLEMVCRTLEEKIPGWQIPVRWELAMHPKKNKALEKLL